MDKIRYAKYVAQQRELNKYKVCQYCGKEHDHTYGTGLFCSKSCRDAYTGNKNKNSFQQSENRQIHLDKIHKNNRSPYGTWECEKCNLIFETKEHLLSHHQQVHKTNIKLLKLENCLFKCPYCEYTGTKLQTMGHLRSCKNHPDKKKHDESYKKGGKTLSQHIKEGVVIPNQTGVPIKPETKEKLRKAALNYRKSCVGEFQASYNKKSIGILESISKEHGWNLQHAENGGEVRMFGYFLDAYDKENNVVVEYDEKEHYIDVENNILRPKDIERQNYIIEKLHCDFYRYNEYTKTLYKINN